MIKSQVCCFLRHSVYVLAYVCHCQPIFLQLFAVHVNATHRRQAVYRRGNIQV